MFTARVSQDCAQDFAASREPPGGQPPQPAPPSVQRLFDYQSISRIMKVLMVYSQSVGCLDHLYYSTFSGNNCHFSSITSPVRRALHLNW